MTAEKRGMRRGVFEEILDLFVPPRCAGCEELSRETFCGGCEPKIEHIDGPYCPQCGDPYPPSAGAWPLCSACRDKGKLDGARSAAFHTGPFREAIIRFKFSDHRQLARPLAAILAKRLANELARPHSLPFGEVDAIVPVVLHPRRRKWRGFDQAELLARELGRISGADVWPDVIERVKDTAPQIQLTPAERAQNMSGAFEARKTWKLGDATLLLIDDVHTTGVTLHEAARALKRAGANRAYALTLARAVPDWHPASFVTVSDDARDPTRRK